MAVDISQVAQLDVEPGALPDTMAAWVIREERQGEPLEAFQLEQIEVPEPGAFEVIVRVMAAGVNFNNVWAALGKPVSVFRYHRRGPPHRRLRRLGHRLEGRRGRHALEARRRGRASTATRPPTRTSRSTASTRSPRPSQKIWGYETTWGSFAQFTKVQAQQLLPKPSHLSWEEAASYGLTYFTAYRMLIDQAKLQAGHRVLIWGAAGGLGVFADAALQARRRPVRRRRLVAPRRASCVKQLGAVGYIDRNEFEGMMRQGGETPRRRRRASRSRAASAKARQELLGGAARHRLRARRPGDVPDLGADASSRSARS